MPFRALNSSNLAPNFMLDDLAKNVSLLLLSGPSFAKLLILRATFKEAALSAFLILKV